MGKLFVLFDDPATTEMYAQSRHDALWISGPCCLAGGLRSLKPTPNVFSFTAKQEWACEELLRPGPSNATRAKLGHATPRTRSQKAPTELLGPAVCKGTGKAPRGAHTSPTATLLRKATQAFFAPSRPLAVGQSGAGLPLAPWALLLCRGSPEPESHSQCVLLRGEAGLGVRRPSSPRPQQCPPSQVGLHSTEVPAPQRHQLSSWVLQSAKGQEKLLGEHTTASPCLCSSKQCQPFSHPAHRSQSCKAGLGCPWLPGPC